jgi:hypothetical protein
MLSLRSNAASSVAPLLGMTFDLLDFNQERSAFMEFEFPEQGACVLNRQRRGLCASGVRASSPLGQSVKESWMDVRWE